MAKGRKKPAQSPSKGDPNAVVPASTPNALPPETLARVFESAYLYRDFHDNASKGQRLAMLDALYAQRISAPNEALRRKALAEFAYLAGRYTECCYWGRLWGQLVPTYKAHRLIAMAAAQSLDLPTFGEAYERMNELNAPFETSIALAVLNRNVLGRYDEALELVRSQLRPMTRSQFSAEPSLHEILTDLATVTEDFDLTYDIVRYGPFDRLPRVMVARLQSIVRKRFVGCVRKRDA